jgi:hypothetical protein
LVERFTEERFKQAVSGYESRIRSAVSQWNLAPGFEPAARRERSVTTPPLPAGFRELAVPENRRTKRTAEDEPGKWPNGMAALPDGFYPVRVERGAPLTVAISLSQNLDPVGEVSGGGYWVHLSRNNGASWDQPVYTGLLHLFPYVAVPKSKMPLMSGDRITLEVAVQELDPSSITYPPVALRSRRQAADLYLEIPLSALQADRDQDGLTDIVEQHLLLDPDRADSDEDGVGDGRDPLPNVRNVPPSAGNGYMEQIFEAIFRTPAVAIVEPVDRDPELAFQGRFVELSTTARPLFLHGRPEEFASLGPASQVLVYTDADIERLSARRPDFHAFSLETIVFNRARSRGYVVWDQGWTGGTLRLTRQGDSWSIEVLSSWIT